MEGEVALFPHLFQNEKVKGETVRLLCNQN